MLIFQNVMLGSFNTFHINAKAKYFLRINSINNLYEISENEIFQREKYFVLGEGSNILFTKDYDGIILKNEISGREIVYEDDKEVVIRFGSGEIWKDIVEYCVENNYCGLENLAEIPGTVGASPVQNIGAYGKEVKDFIYEVEYFDFNERHIKKITASECEFEYRGSIFKTKLKNIFITTVSFRLKKTPELHSEYDALKNELIKRNISTPGIKDVFNVVTEIRKGKLPDPKDIGNAGSFFKNPVISAALFNELKIQYPEIPSYRVDEKFIKIPAGWLIEKAGFKGKRIVNVGTFEKQALVIVNYGGADGKEVQNFANQIIDSVKQLFNIGLTNEVNIL